MAYEFRCRDADHVCRWQGRAGTEDALRAELAEHVRQVHGVPVLSDTIWNYARQNIRHR